MIRPMRITVDDMNLAELRAVALQLGVPVEPGMWFDAEHLRELIRESSPE